MKTFAFIDASNLFYGGEKSLGWKIDYQKLAQYIKEKYGVSRIFYFGGVEIHQFSHDYLNNDSVSVNELEKYLTDFIEKKGKKLDDAELLLIRRHLQRVLFYKKLTEFGYELFLKPVKMYEQDDGTTRRKANCDVEMSFHLMKEKDSFDRTLILSGDGDFLPILKYFGKQKKEVIILSRGPRTAKEIRQFAGANFRDFEYLKYRLMMKEGIKQ